MTLDRRTFLKSLAAATAGLALTGAQEGPARPPRRADRLGPLLPQRRLGHTGQWVTMLGVGGWHVGEMAEKEARETLEAALAGGVRFFDTAERYQGGESERRYGEWLVPRHRDLIFLMTKTSARDGREARRHLEESLRRLKTDYLDLWQIHAVESPEDVEARLAGGVLEVMREARRSGKVRFIGFTGHRTPAAHRRMLARVRDFDACQMPVNLADPGYESFIENALPTLVERRMGVLGMKTLAGGGFFPPRSSAARRRARTDRPVPGRVSVADALSFVWSLPVSAVIAGADDASQFREKIALAKAFQALGADRREALIEKVADLAGRRIEWYKG